jgi:hypothetical protein
MTLKSIEFHENIETFSSIPNKTTSYQGKHCCLSCLKVHQQICIQIFNSSPLNSRQLIHLFTTSPIHSKLIQIPIPNQGVSSVLRYFRISPLLSLPHVARIYTFITRIFTAERILKNGFGINDAFLFIAQINFKFSFPFT